MKRRCTWFIEPIGEYTNGVIAGDQEFLSVEFIHDRLECEGGAKPRLWEIKEGRAGVDKYLQGKKSPGTFFRIWRQINNGEIRIWKAPCNKRIKIPVTKPAVGFVNTPDWAKKILNK